MPPKIERLDASNILEIDVIRKILGKHDKKVKKWQLLKLFDLLIKNTNKVLNDERLDAEIASMEQEDDEWWNFE